MIDNEDDATFLRRNPICDQCLKLGIFAGATWVLHGPDGTREKVCQRCRQRAGDAGTPISDAAAAVAKAVVADVAADRDALLDMARKIAVGSDRTAACFGRELASALADELHRAPRG